MLLYFPGQIASDDLYAVLSNAGLWLAANGVDHVADIKISMNGWREDLECYLAYSDGTMAPAIFDRLIEDGGAPAGAWAPRSGPRVFCLPKPWEQPFVENAYSPPKKTRP